MILWIFTGYYEDHIVCAENEQEAINTLVEYLALRACEREDLYPDEEPQDLYEEMLEDIAIPPRVAELGHTARWA